MDNNIHNRQLGIIHPDKLRMPILIVGAGSIGSWTALALSKLGCSDVTVMDGDIIEEHNAGSQVYRASDAGEEKVVALIDKLRFLTDLPVYGTASHWTPENPEHVELLKKYPIIIAAVDNITVRTQLFTLVKNDPNVLYIDARMAGNALEIYTVRGNNEVDIDVYSKTLFPEGEELPVPCSERSVVYNVFIVAGLVADLVAKAANEQEIPQELVVDLYNLTMFK
jgi:molybdopterin/thiamine biosynthesis adenylyltransferase